jgi:hypothetical protein
MNCDAFETLLSDYLDGTLPVADQFALEAHSRECANCREFMAQVTEGLGALKEFSPVEPPPDLVTRIAYLAPAGRIRRPSERPGWLSRLNARWVQPLLQPRLAMGMAMTFLSFTMMERCTGVQVQRVQLSDLNPIAILQNGEDRLLRAKDRAVKYYQNIRFVYDIEVKLRDMDEQRMQVQDQSRRRAKSQSVNNNKEVKK